VGARSYGIQTIDFSNAITGAGVESQGLIAESCLNIDIADSEVLSRGGGRGR